VSTFGSKNDENGDVKKKKIEEEMMLREFESDLDQLCKRTKLKRGPLNEYEKNLIVER
jgi:hypothetical protein